MKQAVHARVCQLHQVSLNVNSRMRLAVVFYLAIQDLWDGIASPLHEQSPIRDSNYDSLNGWWGGDLDSVSFFLLYS